MSKYYYYYCPICGSTVFNADTTICPNCKNYIKAHQSIHDTEYYRGKSMNMVGNYSYARQILIDEEVSQNPLYNPNTTEHNASEEFNVTMNNKRGESPKANIPTCPTCHSTNVVKISNLKRAAHGIAWGFLSKTAFSQFECKNCGYKW